MTTVEERVDASDNYDVFRHFEGGKEGVRRRFGELIQKGLKIAPYSDVIKLCEVTGIETNVLQEIIHDNYRVINGGVVEAFANALIFTESKFSYGQGLGEILMTPEDIIRIKEQMKKDRFCIPCPSGTTLTDEQICKLFLLSRAAHEL